MALTFKFGADGSQYSRGLSKMRNETKAWSAGIKGMIGGALGGAVLIGGLKKMANQLDRVGKLSARLGKSAEDLQRIGLVAELAGSDMERLAKGLTMVEVNAGMAANGSKAMQEAFEHMNIDIEAFREADLVGQLGMLSDGFILAEESGTGFADVQQLMGGSAKELIPLLRQGSEAIIQQANAAKVASNEMVEDAQKINDEFTLLKNKIMGFFFSVFNGFMELTPALKGFGREVAINVGLTLEKALVHVDALWEALKRLMDLDFDSIADSFKNIDRELAKIDERGDIMKEVATRETAQDVTDRFNADKDRKDKLKTLSKGRQIALLKLPPAEKAKEEEEEKKGEEDKIEVVKKVKEKAKAEEKMKVEEPIEGLFSGASSDLGDASGGGGSSNLIASSIQAIGGGGNVSMLGDPQLGEQKKTNDKLDKLIENTAPAGGTKQVEV